MPDSEALTPGEFNEEWIVGVGKETFSLTREQMSILREAAVSGNRGLIFFDRFALSIPHIACAYLARRTPKNLLPVGEQEPGGVMAPEQAREKLGKIRQELQERMKA